MIVTAHVTHQKQKQFRNACWFVLLDLGKQNFNNVLVLFFKNNPSLIFLNNKKKEQCINFLTWWSNSKPGSQWGIQYFTCACWSEHVKHSDKPLLKETMRKTGSFARNWTSFTGMRVNNLNPYTSLTHVCVLFTANPFVCNLLEELKELSVHG